MESQSTGIPNLEELCVASLRDFIQAISDSWHTGHYPIILTISRRMPHILFWFRHTYASEGQKRILDRTEIITEIALPFIDFSKKKDFEIFILDDVVVSGRTVNYVRTLTEIYTEKEVAKVHVLFCDTYSPFLIFDTEKAVVVGHTFSSKDEKRHIGDLISTIIAVTLPIDVTYPILYFDDSVTAEDFLLFQKFFRDPHSSAIDNYTIKVTYRTDLLIGDKKVKEGEDSESHTSILPSAISNSLNNDFAKIRTYRRLDTFLLVPYAPNILTEGSLTKSALFENVEYKKIWNICLSHINQDHLKSYSTFDEQQYSKELKRNRGYRSLVSASNYLYSLSVFNKLVAKHYDKITTLIGSSIFKYKIRENDLTLIVGKDVAAKILPTITYIVDNRIESPRLHQKVTIPSTFIPKIYEQDYTVSKYLCTSVDESDLKEKLKSIFRNAAERKSSYPAFQLEDIEFGVEGVMESFESLEKAVHPKSYEEIVEIYKWVDERIDNAAIVSRYACVKDKNGLSYWRRFFRLSSSLTD